MSSAATESAFVASLLAVLELPFLACMFRAGGVEGKSSGE